MKLAYKIRVIDGKRVVYLSDPPQYLDACDLWQWMVETRDDNPDLYAQLVHIYFLLKKTTPLPHR